jgi:hypothetical protein
MLNQCTAEEGQVRPKGAVNHFDCKIKINYYNS